MEHLNFYITQGEAGQPVITEVAVELEGMVRHGLKGLSIKMETVLIERINLAHCLPVVKFICKDFPKERLDEFNRHAGEWYVQRHSLLKQYLN